MISRRRVCGAAATLALPLVAGGCAPAAPAPVAGGWVGASHERGHAWRDGRAGTAGGAAPRRTTVAIVGGGVAGLAAAWALHGCGIDDFRVFELEDAAGGNARAHAMDGVTCPLGAHYLPVPGAAAVELLEWLHEAGVARTRFGRTHFDERHLCHAPQERVFVPAHSDPPGQGTWLEGLMPVAEPGGALLAQARRFAAEVQRWQRAGAFAMPTRRAAWSEALAALDRLTFADWLDGIGVQAPELRWLLDYCCRDDFGAGAARVSAWAGVHYFASRHGFHVPGGDAGEADDAGVLTWPEGNAWLTRRLAGAAGARVHAATLVTRISPGRHHVAVDTWDVQAGRAHRWQANHVICCVPLFIAQRLLDAPPAALAPAAARLQHAPWLVSNVRLHEPLLERVGVPLAWDNVLYAPQPHPATDLPLALGYVNALHQSLASVARAPVLTHYWALGGDTATQADVWRARLLQQPWTWWARQVGPDLARAHPDLPGKVRRIDLMRYGHAMAVPVPGVRTDAATGALAALAALRARVHFAHADLSGYSVFEESFTHGVLAARRVAASPL